MKNKLLNIKESSKLLEINKSRFRFLLERKIIPDNTSKRKEGGNFVFLWESDNLLKCKQNVKCYNRGQVVIKKEKPNKPYDQYGSIFNCFIFSHAKAIGII